jgi:hypothetical protein
LVLSHWDDNENQLGANEGRFSAANISFEVN